MFLSEEEYGDWIDSCALRQWDGLIPNSKAAYARQMIRGIFAHAKKEVRVYSGNLSSSRPSPDGTMMPIFIHDGLIKAACGFISRHGTRLKILTEHDVFNGQDNEFLKKIRSAAEGSGKGDLGIQIKKIVRSVPIELKPNNHFCTMDAIGYRFETDHNSSTAVGNFNSMGTTKKLIARFDTMFDEYADFYDSAKEVA